MQELRSEAKRELVKPLQIAGVMADGTIVQLNEVSFRYEGRVGETAGRSNIIDNLSINIDPVDRILLRGPNSCGKSTLLKLLLGELEPSAGTPIRRGHTLYFPQTSLSELVSQHGQESATAYLSSHTQLTETAVRQHLGNYGLKGGMALRSIVTLSAGQKVRLWLAKQLLDVSKPSMLVMDEISENLDVETRNSLLDVLNGFVRAVIAVSHDQDFCENYKCTQTWNFMNRGVRVEHL